MKKKQKIIISIILFALILINVFSAEYTTIIIMNVPVSDSCTPTYNENWIITDECQKENKIIDLGIGNLHIGFDGNLTLINASILIGQNFSCTEKKSNSNQKKCLIFNQDSNINLKGKA